MIKDSYTVGKIKHRERLTTMLLRYPRFIHAEFMTHRVFSRSASSSRAVSIEKLIQDVLDDTAMPIHWGKNQPGMQAKEEHNEDVVMRLLWDNMTDTPYTHLGEHMRHTRTAAWFHARDMAIEAARAFATAGYHKQIVNRLLEPFGHINVLVSSTEWDNFFELRDHSDAQPEIRALAVAMKECMAASEPWPLIHGQWHLPFIGERDYDEAKTAPNETLGTDLTGISTLIKVSIARCARLSYKTNIGSSVNLAADLKLYERLVVQVPVHASPAEHQGTPLRILGYNPDDMCGNFSGFIQCRKMIEASMFK